jgi:hypothetical protein
MKCAGARSAGNPHATYDVAGTGNGATATPKRARRGKPRIQAKEKSTGHRASARPYQPNGMPVTPSSSQTILRISIGCRRLSLFSSLITFGMWISLLHCFPLGSSDQACFGPTTFQSRSWNRLHPQPFLPAKLFRASTAYSPQIHVVEISQDTETTVCRTG